MMVAIVILIIITMINYVKPESREKNGFHQTKRKKKKICRHTNKNGKMKVEKLEKKEQKKPELNKIAYGWTILGEFLVSIENSKKTRIQKKKRKKPCWKHW